MKNKKTDLKLKLEFIGYILLGILIIALAIFGIAFHFHLMAEYGDKPIDEIPTWALWWLFGAK